MVEESPSAWVGVQGRGGKQSATLLQLVRSNAVGEEPELADAYQPGRDDVEQEAAEELDCVVLPLKADAAVFEGSKAMIGDGHAVGIAGQILENPLGSAKRRFGINHPLGAGGLSGPGLKRSRFNQMPKFTGQSQWTLAESGAGTSGGTGGSARTPGGRSIGGTRSSASRPGNASARDHAVQMRMEIQVLAPGVQHCEKADRSAQVLGICGDLQ